MFKANFFSEFLFKILTRISRLVEKSGLILCKNNVNFLLLLFLLLLSVQTGSRSHGAFYSKSAGGSFTGDKNLYLMKIRFLQTLITSFRGLSEINVNPILDAVTLVSEQIWINYSVYLFFCLG